LHLRLGTGLFTMQKHTSAALDGLENSFDFSVFADEPALDKQLREALEESDITPLLLVQAQLSGDRDLLERTRPYIEGGWAYQQKIPTELQAEIRDRLVRTLRSISPDQAARIPDKEEMSTLVHAGLGRPLSDDYTLMFRDEMDDSLDGGREVNWRRPVSEEERTKRTVLIAGAGASGICMAIKLQRLGIPFVIYEKNNSVGGTWFENRYPGSGVDIPSHFYSYSFEGQDHWTRYFAQREELYQYFERIVDKYDLRKHIVFETEIAGAVFNNETNRWDVTVRDKNGEKQISADIFVSAVGILNRPAYPKLPGMGSFKGPNFHTAEWDHTVDLKGKRVAMVGTGASAMQIAPAIAPEVDKLLVFQRSRHWTLSHPLYREEVKPGMRWALKHIPFYAKWCRALLFWVSGDLLFEALNVDPRWNRPGESISEENHKFRERLMAHINSELEGRADLIEKVIPDYPPYGKRMLRDAGWYKMMRRDNVDIIETGVREVTPEGLIDADGNLHEVDVIVWATGFMATKALWPMSVKGPTGEVLSDFWNEDDPRAYLGVTVPKFPNMYVLAGPNTGLGHGGSLFFMIECQVRYSLQAIRDIIEGDLATLDLRETVYDEFARRVDAQLSNMIWMNSGTTSWYHNSKGRVTALWPWRLVDYWKQTYALDPSQYLTTRNKPKSE
jgi:4-hydroxyacetophenone monooxygenase